MERELPSTRAEYDAYVETYGRTPTQDPIYNHAAGSPNSRVSTAQEDLAVSNCSNLEADHIEAGTATQAEIDSAISNL